MAIDLGPFQFEDELVLRQLRRDLRDDWFPDPREFEDIFRHDQIQGVLTQNFHENEGVYRPTKRSLLNVPKSNFTLRYALETGAADRALYQGIATYLIPFYDPLLPWNVFNHRQAEAKDSEKYLFKRAVQSWQDFTGVVKNSVKTNPTLLSTDLTNYFENINLDILRQTLQSLIPEIKTSAAKKARIRSHLAILFDCLREWCFSEHAGLPQNRDASSFLANVYMLPVDRAMLQRGHQYFRYMDDIKIACRDEFQARRALKELSLELRKIGLSVNSGKTQICRAGDEEALEKCLDLGGTDLHQLDAIWNTRAIRPISRSFPLLKELTQRLLRSGEVDKRIFRYCIRRLEVLAQCPEFAVPPEYFDGITPLVVDALASAPAATDQLARYLRSVPLSAQLLEQISALLRDPEKNFYTWQSYRLWALLVQKEYTDPELMLHALDLVRTAPDDANRAGATLYVGALGSKAERVVVAENFSRSQSFLGQRTALLAVQELHYRPYIEAHVQPHLREDLRDVYRGLSREGVYMAPPEADPITRYIDLGRDYD